VSRNDRPAREPPYCRYDCHGRKATAFCAEVVLLTLNEMESVPREHFRLMNPGRKTISCHRLEYPAIHFSLASGESRSKSAALITAPKPRSSQAPMMTRATSHRDVPSYGRKIPSHGGTYELVRRGWLRRRRPVELSCSDYFVGGTCVPNDCE
jgi:hypothetical protein